MSTIILRLLIKVGLALAFRGLKPQSACCFEHIFDSYLHNILYKYPDLIDWFSTEDEGPSPSTPLSSGGLEAPVVLQGVTGVNTP